MDDWSGNAIPGLARIDFAVEQVQADCDDVNQAIPVTSEVVEFFIYRATDHWILEDEDRGIFKQQVILAWNAKQIRIKRGGY